MRLKIIRSLVAFGAGRLTLSSLVQHAGILPACLRWIIGYLLTIDTNQAFRLIIHSSWLP